jgi:hypothetical protein
MTPAEALETYLNGNVADFTYWLKESSKTSVLEAILVLAEDDRMLDTNLSDTIGTIQDLLEGE